MDAVAVQRFEEALRRPCHAPAITPRPYRGLRAELLDADAILRVKVLETRSPDPPPGGWSEAGPLRQEVDAVVRKVLAGSVARVGDRLRLAFNVAASRMRNEQLPRYGSTILFWSEPHEEWANTFLVRRDGDRLTLLTVMASSDDVRTDAVLAEYGRLARRDDRDFLLGLARHLADWVCLRPDRLLWESVGWTAMEDWRRQEIGPVRSDPRFRRLLTEAHRTVETKLERWLQGHPDEWGANTYDLPWLIRLLPLSERRQLAATLLRLHTVATREEAEARVTEEELQRHHPSSPDSDYFPLRWAAASALVHQITVALAVCVDPSADGPPPDTVDRARAFVRGGPGDPELTMTPRSAS